MNTWSLLDRDTPVQTEHSGLARSGPAHSVLAQYDPVWASRTSPSYTESQTEKWTESQAGVRRRQPVCDDIIVCGRGIPGQ